MPFNPQYHVFEIYLLSQKSKHKKINVRKRDLGSIRKGSRSPFFDIRSHILIFVQKNHSMAKAQFERVLMIFIKF